ncbi:MAG: chromosome segregation protein SMC, partial [Deltaproteobacteria bacterium]|nr:chromosome segregation protein SMC [Deltaproteobacteria bacterium]
LNAIREALTIAGEKKESTGNSLRISTERLSVLQSESGEKNERLKRLKENMAATGARLKTLEEMETNLDGLRDGARTIMQSREERNGVHGLLADVLEAHKGYEKAVEAALGESLQYVIVESQSAGIEAVEYLKSNSTGRGTFIPMNGARIPTETSAAQAPPMGTTFLKNEVKVKDGFSSIVNYLLDGVIVVRDLNQAVEIWNQNGVARTFVTSDGELLNPEGMITGGYSNGSDGGMLVKRTQIKELTSEMEEIKDNIATLERELNEIEAAITESTTEAEAHKEDLYTKDIDQINKEGELKRLTDGVEHIGERIQAAIRDVTATEAELEAIKAKKIDLAREREGLEGACTGREGVIAGLSHETTSLREEREKTSIGTTDIKVTLAAVEERFEHTAHKIADKDRQTRDMSTKQDLKRSEVSAGKVEAEELKVKVAGHKETLEGLLVKKDAVSRDVTLEEETLSEAMKKIQELEGSIKKIHSESNQLHTQKGELTIEATELDMSLTNMKEKTIERYGISLDDYTPTEDMADTDLSELGRRVGELREKIGKMGEVSLGALEEFTELEERYNFLIEQESDLNESIDSLKSAITRINSTTRVRFRETFEAISKEFSKNFPRFFSGGKAELRLTGEGDILDQGIEIVAQPPGKKLQNINLLSGGEKALTATALIFSIFLIKPSPFCLLDEVDAPLDDANIDRFNGFVTEMSKKSQFILITHNKRTMEMADTLFGITMAEPGVSRIVSVDL